jgi:MoaA/NifB/PqqE/SkfB family radical SAM enzyme
MTLDPIADVIREPRSGAGAGNQVASVFRDRRRNVEINVGKACNNKCVFCLDGMPSKEQLSFMPFDEMKAELERWRGEGHSSVGFLGGEPTMYPRIADSVAYARDLGFTRITLATNAMMFRRQDFTDKLIAAGLTRVTISMHGHTTELEDRLTAVPGAFEKKVQAIANLRRYRDQGALRDGLSVNIVLNGWNYRQLPRMMRFFFDEMKLDDLRVNFVRPEGYAEGSSDLTPTFSDVMPVLMKAIVLNEYHFRKVFTFGGVPMCVLPPELLNSKHLLPRYMGDIFRDLSTDCSIRSEGVDGGVAQVDGGRSRFNWQDRKRFDLKDHVSSCDGCLVAEVCEGVWRGYLDIYGDSEIAPLSHEDGRYVRSRPRPKGAPAATGNVAPRKYPVRLMVFQP